MPPPPKKKKEKKRKIHKTESHYTNPRPDHVFCEFQGCCQIYQLVFYVIKIVSSQKMVVNYHCQGYWFWYRMHKSYVFIK